MATPTAAPMTRLRRLSRDAASARKSSSPLGGMAPASVDGKVDSNLHQNWRRIEKSLIRVPMEETKASRRDASVTRMNLWMS